MQRKQFINYLIKEIKKHLRESYRDNFVISCNVYKDNPQITEHWNCYVNTCRGSAPWIKREITTIFTVDSVFKSNITWLDELVHLENWRNKSYLDNALNNLKQYLLSEICRNTDSE
jgi:hypothetical protein